MHLDAVPAFSNIPVDVIRTFAVGIQAVGEVVFPVDGTFHDVGVARRDAPVILLWTIESIKGILFFQDDGIC